MLDYLVLNPLVGVSIANGALWVLPLMAGCSAAVWEGFVEGRWAKEWKTGMVVRGCAGAWRVAAEGLKVQRAVAAHWVGVKKPMVPRVFGGVCLKMIK